MADEAKTPEVTDTPAAAAEERFNKPNKDDLDKRVGEIEGEIKDLQAKQEALHDFRKAATAGGPKTGPLADARAAFKVIADKARVLRDERKGYFDQLALMKGAREKMNAQMDAMKDSMGPMKSLDDLNKKIKQLENKHSATSLPLKEEKILIKELEALKMMRKEAVKIEGAKAKAAGGAEGASSRDNISERLDATKEQLAKLNAEMDAQKAVMEKLQSKDKSQSLRAQIPAVLRELDRLSSEIDGCFTRIRALRNDFREDNNKWYEYSKVLREQKQKKYEEQAEERKAAWETRQAEIEAEEALKVPWEEEMALCDFIITYMEGLIADKTAADEEKAAATELDGMVAFKRDDEDLFAATGGKKLKKKGKGKKTAALKHSITTIEDFGLLSLMPPTTQEGIAASIDEVKAAKEAFKIRPREPKKPKASKRDDADDKPKAKKGPAKKYEHDTSDSAFPKLGQ